MMPVADVVSSNLKITDMKEFEKLNCTFEEIPSNEQVSTCGGFAGALIAGIGVAYFTAYYIGYLVGQSECGG